MKNKTLKGIVGVVVLVIVTVCCVLGVLHLKKQKDAERKDLSSDYEQQTQAIDNTVEWKGKNYVYNPNLYNVLFMGIDSTDPIESEQQPGTAGQSDCLMLLSLNEDTKQAKILQINRNAMTQIDVYDFSGNFLKNIDGQITLQYAYANGGENSCWATKKTLQELLYGLPIDGYFAMNLEALQKINDAIGGVDVTMREDYTDIHPDFIKGHTVHLEGGLTERFVRYRDINVFNSVEGRMHRQVEYVTALIGKMRSSGGQKLYDILSPYLGEYVTTDMDADHIDAFSSYEYLTNEVEYLPGETKMGDVYEEFYIDEEQLQDLLIRTFYMEVG